MVPGEPNAFQRDMAGLAASVTKAVATILVPDVARALEWYVSIGFKELARFEDDGLVNFGIVSFGQAEVMLNMHGHAGTHDVSLWFYTDRVDALYQLLKTRQHDGISFDQELEHMFYGVRQFCIRDLNGYQLYFIQQDRA